MRADSSNANDNSIINTTQSKVNSASNNQLPYEK